MFAARVRNGFVPALRATVFRKFKDLESRKCPFANLPESEKGRWGEGRTAADMEKYVWLKPKLVAAIEYAEWTPANHLRLAATPYFGAHDPLGLLPELIDEHDVLVFLVYFYVQDPAPIR
jgi:ATP-dependent DNA ligase